MVPGKYLSGQGRVVKPFSGLVGTEENIYESRHIQEHSIMV
jgi:hypothetical protein